MPLETVVPPVWVQFPWTVNVLNPPCVTVPLPEISLVTAILSDRLKTNPALLRIPPLIEPAVPPAPIWITPLEMVVPPVFDQFPVSVSVLDPACVTEPVPDMAYDTAELAERL